MTEPEEVGMAERVTVLGRLEERQSEAMSRPLLERGEVVRDDRLTKSREDDPDELSLGGETRKREDHPDPKVGFGGPETRSREDDRTTESRGDDF